MMVNTMSSNEKDILSKDQSFEEVRLLRSALKEIDDLFEYRFKGYSKDELQEKVHEILDNCTKELERIHAR